MTSLSILKASRSSLASVLKSYLAHLTVTRSRPFPDDTGLLVHLLIVALLPAPVDPIQMTQLNSSSSSSRSLSAVSSVSSFFWRWVSWWIGVILFKSTLEVAASIAFLPLELLCGLIASNWVVEDIILTAVRFVPDDDMLSMMMLSVQLTLWLANSMIMSSKVLFWKNFYKHQKSLLIKS